MFSFCGHTFLGYWWREQLLLKSDRSLLINTGLKTLSITKETSLKLKNAYLIWKLTGYFCRNHSKCGVIEKNHKDKVHLTPKASIPAYNPVFWVRLYMVALALFIFYKIKVSITHGGRRGNKSINQFQPLLTIHFGQITLYGFIFP